MNEKDSRSLRRTANDGDMIRTYYNTVILGHFTAQNPFTVAPSGLISDEKIPGERQL